MIAAMEDGRRTDPADGTVGVPVSGWIAEGRKLLILGLPTIPDRGGTPHGALGEWRRDASWGGVPKTPGAQMPYPKHFACAPRRCDYRLPAI